MSHANSRRYKESTFQQLRSFYETARLGSLSAAADSLGLSHPTVWAQVHALERELGCKLIEPFGRGSRLTLAGQRFAELVGPVVLGAASLRQRFREIEQQLRPTLTVAATPRVLTDDLPDCVREFLKRRPDVDLTLHEVTQHDAIREVAQGRADIALAGLTALSVELAEEHKTWIVQEPAYDLAFVLVTPKNHPLARKRRVRPEDLAGYPFVTGPLAFSELDLRARLESHGVFSGQACRVEAQFTATSRQYVWLGFGIGIVSKRPAQPPHPDLHERDMSEFFGHTPVCLVRQKGQPQRPVVQEFQAIVRELLGPAKTSDKPNRPARKQRK
jgi:DNA-binding transcriptional LysR family regulator